MDWHRGAEGVGGQRDLPSAHRREDPGGGRTRNVPRRCPQRGVDIAVTTAPELGDDRLAQRDEARASVRVSREPWSAASYLSLKKMNHGAHAALDTRR